MKLKWLWLLLPACLVLALTFVLVTSGSRGKLSGRFVSVKSDSMQRSSIVYELTNSTRDTVELTVVSTESLHEKTGWWWETCSETWYVEKSAGTAFKGSRVELRPKSAARFEIILLPNGTVGSALRVKVQQVKIEHRFVRQLRSLGDRLRLPSHWLMLPKPALLELPLANLPAQIAAVRSGGSPARGSGSVSAPVSDRPSNGPVLPGTSVSSLAGHPQEEIIPAGVLQFWNVNLKTFLDFYAHLADAQLEIDPPLRELRTTFHLQNPEAVTRSGAVRLFEQALREAGINVQRLDTNRIWLASNYALKTH